MLKVFMAKMGAPTKYKKAYCKEAIVLLSKGYSKEALAGHLSVSKQTLYTWMEKHDDFVDAIKEGETKSLLFWETMGIGGAMGKIDKFNVTSWIFNMKNRHGWKDKSDDEIEAMKETPKSFNLTFNEIDASKPK